MADKQAEPLVQQLKSDPQNAALWNQLGLIYKATHQFKDAETYLQKSLDIDPRTRDYARGLLEPYVAKTDR